MAKKDKKGRNLYKGERQRKDGRYEYRYTNSLGKQKSVYSWRLVETDATPAGKPKEQSLREMEREINRDILDGITPTDVTLNEYFEVFMDTKKELKEHTRVHYRDFYDRYAKPVLGQRPLASINYTVIKRFYNTLLEERNLALSTMKVLNNVLHQMFENAIKDGLVRTNPTRGALKELQRIIKPPTTREPLSKAEQTAFMTFVSSNAYYRRWYSLFLFLLCTGCRIGEAAGLKWKDCDFEKNEINISRTLAYSRKESGENGITIGSPKTKSSTRTIPMMSILKETLLSDWEHAGQDDYDNEALMEQFVFHGRTGGCIYSHIVDQAIHNARNAYNNQELQISVEENREPLLLPKFTAHTFRHTFCTRFSENETNIRTIMDIMGHSNINTTMNIYSKATAEVKHTSMHALEEKVFVM